jgi:hypothetical protein
VESKSVILFCLNCLTFADHVLSSYWLRRRILVTDGNFKADHMKMRRPELDVVLTDGEGYFVEDAPYQKHLKEFQDIKQVGIEILITCLFILTTILLDK